MIIKLNKTLKTAPNHNYFCILNGNTEEIENADNEFIYGKNETILRRKERLYKGVKMPTYDYPNIIDDWYGCVSYIPTEDGYIISTVESDGRNKVGMDVTLRSALELLRDWMVRTGNTEICMPHSIYKSCGISYRKTIHDIIKDIFNDDEDVTVYICKEI